MHHCYFPNSVGPISYLGYKYIHVFGFGQKGKVFFVEKTTVELNDRNHGQGTHSAKMGADNLAENTLQKPKFICNANLPN